MKRNTQNGRVMSALLIAVVLVACSISGLAAGVYARHLGDSFVIATTTAPAPAPSRTPPRAVATATTITASTATSTPHPAGSAEFVLSATASPNALSSGQSVTVTVIATTTNSSKAPIAGLRCYMRAPTDGRPPLLSGWPPPQITGANGQAAWNLTTPQVAPGTYGVEVVAYGANSYHYYADAFVTITG